MRFSEYKTGVLWRASAYGRTFQVGKFAEAGWSLEIYNQADILTRAERGFPTKAATFTEARRVAEAIAHEEGRP